MSETPHRLHWTHPQIGDINEVVCPAHESEVLRALRVLGMGSVGSGGSVSHPKFTGPGELPVCLRCQANAAMPPRVLLRQWFGEAAS